MEGDCAFAVTPSVKSDQNKFLITWNSMPIAIMAELSESTRCDRAAGLTLSGQPGSELHKAHAGVTYDL